ncbi:MAG: hypothetical protein AB1801_16175 [Chloroflexota bacterium]
MKLNSYRLLQALLWCVCAYHVIVAVGLNTSTGFLRLMAGYYGAHVDWTPQFVYILKPLGAFMLVLGGLAAVAALNPRPNRPIVYAFATLFILRAGQRIVFAPELYSAFAISSARNIGHVIFFLGLAAILLILSHSAQR